VDAADFVGKYQSLSIMADMPNAPFTCTVACNKYLIATQGNIADIRAKQGNVIAAIKKGGATFDSGAAARLSNGKASPGDMEDLLSSAVEANALPPDPNALQRWADANLGVDCTGFVVAYLVEIGVLGWNATLNGGLSCPYIYTNVAKLNWALTRYADQPEIWDVDDMQANDIIIWAKSGGGPETKHPGHISIIVSTDHSGFTCAESNDSDDNHDGVTGPKKKVRRLETIQEGGGKRWWQHSTGVIVVRPPSGSG